MAFAVSITGDTAAAEDAAQEAFVSLWERRERWEGDSARAILFGIARKRALDRSRRRRVRARLADRVRGETRPKPTPEEALVSEEVTGQIRAAIAGLPEKRREVFELVRLHGMTYAETAEILGRSPRTVANHMSLALADLRTLLASLLAGSGSDPEGHRREGDPPNTRSSDG